MGSRFTAMDRGASVRMRRQFHDLAKLLSFGEFALAKVRDLGKRTMVELLTGGLNPPVGCSLLFIWASQRNHDKLSFGHSKGTRAW